MSEPNNHCLKRNDRITLLYFDGFSFISALLVKTSTKIVFITVRNGDISLLRQLKNRKVPRKQGRRFEMIIFPHRPKTQTFDFICLVTASHNTCACPYTESFGQRKSTSYQQNAWYVLDHILFGFS